MKGVLFFFIILLAGVGVWQWNKSKRSAPPPSQQVAVSPQIKPQTVKFSAMVDDKVVTSKPVESIWTFVPPAYEDVEDTMTCPICAGDKDKMRKIFNYKRTCPTCKDTGKVRWVRKSFITEGYYVDQFNKLLC